MKRYVATDRTSDCPGPDLALTYLSGFLSPEEEETARQHFSFCASCVDFLTAYKQQRQRAEMALANEKSASSERLAITSRVRKLILHNSTLLMSLIAGIAFFLTGFLHLYYDYQLANGSFTIMLIGSAAKLFIIGFVLSCVGSIALWYNNHWTLHQQL